MSGVVNRAVFRVFDKGVLYTVHEAIVYAYVFLSVQQTKLNKVKLEAAALITSLGLQNYLNDAHFQPFPFKLNTAKTQHDCAGISTGPLR